MDKIILKRYIQKIVKEEISTILKENLKQLFVEAFTSDSKSSSNNKPSSSSNNSTDYQGVARKQITNSENPKPKYVKYTNNPLLNDVLNETTGGVPSEGSPVGLMGQMEPITLNENMIPPNAPKEVKKVHDIINRDFSKTLKAIDKIKENK